MAEGERPDLTVALEPLCRVEDRVLYDFYEVR